LGDRVLAAAGLELADPFDLPVFEAVFRAACDPLERRAVLAELVLPPRFVLAWAILGSSPP